MTSDLPIGNPVNKPAAAPSPGAQKLQGHHVLLKPLDPGHDTPHLHACSHGSDEIETLWTYMGYGPFKDQSAMRTWLETCVTSTDPLFRVVVDRTSGQPVGMVSYLNIVPDAWRLELGHIWYAPTVQRTNVNTEAIYLMLCECFDRLKYRRIEWKCDALNARSRAAALRLGFSFEGIFRQHLIYKGRNRDTAWFSMLDTEWPRIKANIDRWLYQNDGTLSLTELTAG